MDGIPFRIKEFHLNSDTQKITIGPVSPRRGTPIPCYYVVSTAPPNIEDALQFSPQDGAKTQRGIRAIAQDLYRIYSNSNISESPELTITVHGYNTHENGIQAWYTDIVRYINRVDPAIKDRSNVVFIGYRWSSESFSMTPKNLIQNLKALPPIPKWLLTSGTLMSGVWLVLALLMQGKQIDFLFGVLLGLASSAAALIVALVLLRLSVYFRDVYRATNFGVLDLVELVRRLDKEIIDQTATDLKNTQPDLRNLPQAAQQHWENNPRRIKLNFIGHSMGALVVTNIVRILSDVFDNRSVAKYPPPNIGRTLSLERLILAAPDIPILSIISSRTNFLAPSLRRFKEAYLFSNEGDLALRFASTAVNYISFPSATRTRGYRLGNVALANTKDYGITNLENLHTYFRPEVRLQTAIQADPDDILKNLYITHGGTDQDGYLSLAELFSEQDKSPVASITLADLFTFFDCTDYFDTCVCFEGTRRRPISMGLLSRAKRKGILNAWDYTQLIFDSALGRRDVHGGYFHGDFSRQLIYRLAFVGFEGVLKASAQESLMSSCDAFSPQVALEILHEKCQKLGIQAYLSPLHYRVSVQGQRVEDAKQEMLQTIQQKSKTSGEL
ncbi:MAG: alpha/beta hydrolase [Cyanobacteria bacterium J06635_1]